METERLKLVPPCIELQPQMLEAILESKEELAIFLPWVPYALTEAESSLILNKLWRILTILKTNSGFLF